MYLFWAGTAVLLLRILVPYVWELLHPDPAAFSGRKRCYIYPNWFDLLGLGLILADTWAAYSQVLWFDLVLLVAIVLGTTLTRLQMYAWLVAWHLARQQAERRQAAASHSIISE